MLFPTAAHMSPVFWYEQPGPSPARWTFVLQQLQTLASSARLTTIGLICRSTLVDGLQHVFPLCPDLRRLEVSSNGNLGLCGTTTIAATLHTCTALTHLQLRRNDMRVEGVRQLLRTIRRCVVLQHIDLSLNGIGDEGVLALAPVLVHCTALAHLDLGANMIQEFGASVLAQHVQHYPALTHFNIGHNDLRNTGAAHLAAALRRCPLLKVLDLSNNRCSHPCLYPALCTRSTHRT